MKITDLSVTLVRWEIPKARHPGYTEASSWESQLGVVTVRTDEGVEGHSFVGNYRQGAADFVGPMIRFLKPIVMGRNPLDIGALWTEMWAQNRLVHVRAIGAVDVALWDLAGKVAGLPVHRLLGTCRDRAPAYASSALLPTPEEYAEEALSFRSDGWPAYKIHPHMVAGEDIEISRAVREAVGDSYTLMLDSMWAYRYEEALRVGRAIEELGYYWYEDPLAEDDIYGCVKLRQKLDIPLLATEYTPGGLYGLAEWVTREATDMLRGDVAIKGGITGLVKIAHLAEAFGMNCEIHHGGNSLNNVANLHVTMAINNCEFFEVLLPHSANKFGLVEDIPIEDGYVHAPEEPGLGYEIDWDLVKRETVGVAS